MLVAHSIELMAPPHPEGNGASSPQSLCQSQVKGSLRAAFGQPWSGLEESPRYCITPT